MKKIKNKSKEIKIYDESDFGSSIGGQKPKKLSEIGISLPPTPPSQVVSIRVPTQLLNQIRAAGSEKDIPYQALMKQFLFDGMKRYKKTG